MTRHMDASLQKTLALVHLGLAVVFGIVTLFLDETGLMVAGLLPQQAHSHQMWEIKGVKIMASEVKLEDSPALNPAVIELQNIEEFTRANCLNRVEQAAENKPGWSEWSACPTGQVATGVRAYYGNDKCFTGLKLQCKTVASKRIEAFPIRDNIGY